MRKRALQWLLKQPRTWVHLRQAPGRQLTLFLAAVFLLFSVIGFYFDVMQGGTEPYAIVLTIAIYSGLNALLWVLVVAGLPRIFILLMIAKEVFLPISSYLVAWVREALHPAAVSPQDGLHFAGTAIIVVVIGSYCCFSAHIALTGRESVRLKTELSLAHSIQKTLVPPVSLATASFEMYGISEPSEKVGGDLVDVVELPGGDAVAYLADIAGHGLQAGILMGMLKTAARTALGDCERADGSAADGASLSQLMARLNRVLPQVKEAHMYATFAGLRLKRDGRVYYGMAASPPLLHWSAARGAVERIDEEQFPLGLLPVAEFPASRLAMEPGDVVVIATDGILEVTGDGKGLSGVEFGADALAVLIGRLLARRADEPLPAIAAAILADVRSYGKQLDDQTLLLVRRRA